MAWCPLGNERWAGIFDNSAAEMFVQLALIEFHVREIPLAQFYRRATLSRCWRLERSWTNLARQ
jgi:hypothetical protein